MSTLTTAVITETEVRASIRRVIDHAESIWDEWAWQVENQTWAVLGYASWDEMRRGEYGALTSIAAPRAERPELVARFRGAGLTQQQTADTLSVHVNTVKNHDAPTYQPRVPKAQNCTSSPIDAEWFCDACGGDGDSCECDESNADQPVTPATPKASPRKPLTDTFWTRLYDLGRNVESLHRLTEDDRWTQNAEKLATAKNRNELQRINDLLQQVINHLPTEEPTNV